MNSQTVEITSTGIKKILNKYTPERAISEYVWNGFDAKATVVNIDFEIDSKELDTFKWIRISDNGSGICYEELPNKFQKFYESQKAKTSNNKGLTRGENGYGRFTFYKFARFATWNTTYLSNEKPMFYDIRISGDNLKDYSPTIPVASANPLGTSVVFDDVFPEMSSQFIDEILIPYLKAEFAWFLELKEEHKIYVNGVELDYSSIISEVDNFTITPQNSEEEFDCKYIRWDKKINDEYSRFYFMNNNLDLKNTQTTLLNKKGDGFWHSVIIINDFFDEINSDSEDEDNSVQGNLFDNTVDKRLFRNLVLQLNNYLRDKRRPFLKIQASVLVNKYEEDKVFPTFGDNEWDKARKEGLEDLVKSLYEVEPAVFMKLNKEQKKVFLGLLNLVMDSGERESLFN